MFSNALKSFTSNISSNYILSPSPVSHSGPWKIHDAKKKKTNQSVSVWVFERKSLDPGGGNLSLRGSNSRDGLKAAQDEVVERLKKEASLLARLRHPCVLELVEPVEDTRGGGLMFATEQVMCSLGVLLAEKDEEEGRGAGARRRREVDIDELEIQKGLLQIGKALEFLHESAALVHGNLTPEAVVINAKSDWKLTSLSFTISSISPPLPPAFDPRLPPFVQHSLDYSAPDLTLDSTLTPSSDLFSLGLLIIALYNHPHRSPLETHNSPSTYRRLLTSASTTPSPHNNYLSTRPLPRPLLDSLLPTLLTRHPSTRCTAREFQQSPYFDNILVSALRFLDALPAKTPSEKASFMRGLPKILPQFPRGVLEKKVLPGLVEELRDDTMLALILPNIFIIASQGSARLFQDRVLTRLKEVFIAPASTTEAKTAAAKIAEREKEAGREGGLTVVLSHLSVIMEKTTAREFKDDILPIYQLALESSTHALQDLALRSLGGILPKLDFPTLKGEVFPVVAGVFTKTSSLGIKIRGLEAFKVLCGGMVVDEKDAYAKQRAVRKEECPVLDKYTIQEKVVPLLKGIKTKEPAVMMAALEVFAQVGGLCDREVVAMELLPGLWTMSFGPLLGLSQFQAFMSTIKSLSAKIEQEQTRKLQELGTTTTPANTDILSFGGTPGPRPMSTSNDTEFENLVFGKPTSAPANGWGTPPPQKKPETPAFSWSTPAVSGRIGSLSPPPQRQSRAVTPDVNLSTFTPMTPGTPGSPGMGGMNMAALNLQPSAGFGSTTALRPTPQQPATIDWSSALTPSKPTFTSPPLSTPSFTALTPNRPTFTPPPLSTPSFTTLTPKSASGYNYNQNKTNGGTTQESHPTILYGQTRHQAAPTGSGAFAGFMIPPPPGGGMNLVIGSKKEEKKGLDQWESLL